MANMTSGRTRRRQVAVLGSADPGERAYDIAIAAGSMLGRSGFTVISGCGSPATLAAAASAFAAGGEVVAVIPEDNIGHRDVPCSILIPCGMGSARNVIMALAGDACVVIGGRAGTISEVCLAWLHRRPLLPLVGCGGWSERLPSNPPDERALAPILAWSNIEELTTQLSKIPPPASGLAAM